MQTHTLNVLGLDVTFKAEADPIRVERACALLEERQNRLTQDGRLLSKEKLLTFIALSLADDIVILQDSQEETAQRVEKLLASIENLVEQPPVE